MVCRAAKPSSSTSNWLSVWSRSSLPLNLGVRLRPTASSSSRKMTQGAFSRALLNRARTRFAPNPTYISTNSQALEVVGSAQELHEFFDLLAHFVDARHIGEGDRGLFQFWTNWRGRRRWGPLVPGRGVIKRCLWRMGVSPFGFGTVPDLIDAHVIANGTRRPNTPAREQNPDQDQQEE